jgi:hypothetical protein
MTVPAQTLDADWPEEWTWQQTRDHLKQNWERGQHVAIMAPTGTGKSYLATRGLMPLWSHGIVIDAKPQDPDNLKHAAWMGAKISPTYPTPNLGHLWGKDPYPDRYYWVAPPLNSLQEGLDEALKGVWGSAKDGKGWVCYIDELKLICARQPDGHDLAAHVTRMLRYGRARGITFIGGTQSPRYNGPGMSDFLDQPTLCFVGKTRDAAVCERYAEMSGMGRKLGMAVVPTLGKREWWLISGQLDLNVRFEMPPPNQLRRPRVPRERAV